ncbi:DsbA family protein [Spirillospora sp. NPDC050679]
MGKAERDRSARERLADERVRGQTKARQRRLLLAAVGAVAAVAAVVAVVVVAVRGGDDDGGAKTASSYTGPLAPVSRQADGSTLMAQAGVAEPVLELFEDFQCPVCKKAEDASGDTIKRLAGEGALRVVYRPLQLFRGADREPLSSNSHRAANAALCAPADRWLAFHDTLYANQPEEGDEGFSNADLVSWGQRAGITDPAFPGCVNGDAKAAELAKMTEYALTDRKIEGTPTVLLDGKALDLRSQVLDPGGLEKAVRAAGRG